MVDGRPRPRVETHAPYQLSRAQEAIGWAAKCGLLPDTWQDDSLDRICAVNTTGKWVHFECGEIVPRQNGKGSILEIRALAGLFVFREELIMWSAHEYKTAIEAFRRCLKLLRRAGTQVGNNENLLLVDGHVVKVSNTNGEEGFEVLKETNTDGELVLLAAPRRLKFIARSKSSGRGFSGDLNIIDEAFAYTNEQHEALLFTMSARANPQIIYTSSPPLNGITGDVMFDLRLRGDPTAPRELADGPWTQDPSLAWRDWGLAGDLENLDEVDLDDQTLWKATNPSLDVVRAGATALSTASVERERRSFRNNPAGFARERLGVWPKRARASGGVIPLALWAELATTPDAHGRPAQVMFAINVARDRSFTTIAAVGVQADGRLQLAIVAYERGTEWVVRRIRELRERWDPLLWAIEDKGANASLWAADLDRANLAAAEDRDKPKRGEVVAPWANDVAAGYGLFIDALVDKQLAHLRDAPLEAAVAGAQTRPISSGGTTWDDKGAVEVSPLKAVTNALWAWHTYAEKILAAANPWDHVY
ncbi:hypothetical protein ACTOB_001385 [Actinoplanes oblitus]|uniref:Terminase n=1 Tax=Actinoplanes oblitus TaxID=3040509 RepID=A0ABY8WLD5_9ACTN|nr:hypothetical protein [Actinoplanes oblitus]WIM97831.1 hypothetical protein ACTOB_001385 [Actinoplanes oblitus]